MLPPVQKLVANNTIFYNRESISVEAVVLYCADFNKASPMLISAVTYNDYIMAQTANLLPNKYHELSITLVPVFIVDRDHHLVALSATLCYNQINLP